MHSFLVDKLQTVCSILALPLKANSCGMFDLAVAWGHASICHNIAEMLLAPIDEGIDSGHQRLARVGQGILYTRWYLWKHFPMYQVTLLQTLQCLREHLLRTVGHQTAHLVEPQHARLTPVE